MTDEDKPIPKYLTNAYWEQHPFRVIRKPASPKVNGFDEHVMNRAEYIRKRKGIRHHDILPMDERYWRLLKTLKRKISISTIFLIAQGLGVSVDDLVQGYNEE
jgi:hypothetical protein